jgi:hypothetical protein
LRNRVTSSNELQIGKCGADESHAEHLGARVPYSVLHVEPHARLE